MGLLGLAGDFVNGLLGEDSVASLPVVGDVLGSKKDSEKALLAKQAEMAREMEKRARINEQARMNALGQSILAFNPQNQMLAQMVGPQAAFSPEQFAQMAGNPFPAPQAPPGGQGGGQQLPPPSPTDIINGGGGLRAIKQRAQAAQQQINQGQQQQAEQQAAAAFQQEDERRRQQIMQQMSPLPQGPTPLRMARPAPARRF